MDRFKKAVKDTCSSSQLIKFFPKYVCFPESWLSLEGLDLELIHSPQLVFLSYVLPALKILPRRRKKKKDMTDARWDLESVSCI